MGSNASTVTDRSGAAVHPLDRGTLGGWPCDHGGVVEVVQDEDGSAEVWALVDHEWRRIAGLSVLDRAAIAGALTAR